MPDSILNLPTSKVDLAGFWLKRWEIIKSSRYNFDSLWSAVARRIYPEADEFNSVRTPGERRRQQVYSSKGSRSLAKWKALWMSLLVPKDEQWHKYEASEEDLNKEHSVKLFFEQLTNRAFKLRNSSLSGFYAAMDPTFESLGAWGNGCFFMEEVPGGVRYMPIALPRVWFGLDQYKRVRTVFYQSRIPAAAADMKWRKVWGDAPPEAVKRRLQEDAWGEMLDFLHVVTPRDNQDPESLGPERLPFQSFWISIEDKMLIEQGGYPEMPYIVGRETILAHENYARGPFAMLLPELGGVNAMKKTNFITGERSAAPPLLLSEDADLGSRSIVLAPDAVNRGLLDSNGKPMLVPLQSGAKLELTREMVQDEELAIDDALGLNLLRILIDEKSPVVTATQILEEAQQRGQLSAPGVNSRQAEMLGPEAERLVGIMGRQRMMPEVPPILLESGGDYQIKYTSPANRLQKAGQLAAVTRTMEVIAPLAANDPTIWHKFNAERLVELSMEIQGGPTEALLSEEEFAAVVQAIQKQQEAAAVAEQAPNIAGAMKDGGQALQLLQGGGGGT